MFLENLDSAVSYSDGEGAKAGVGIAIWSPRLPNGPLAAFLEAPAHVRTLWDNGRHDDHMDIFLIEAVGPLAILETSPNIGKNSLWVHYIDNVAAQYSLIKGSSSISCGDVVVGGDLEADTAVGGPRILRQGGVEGEPGGWFEPREVGSPVATGVAGDAANELGRAALRSGRDRRVLCGSSNGGRCSERRCE